MKFLEHSHFEALNAALNLDAGIYRIIGRYYFFVLFCFVYTISEIKFLLYTSGSVQHIIIELNYIVAIC